VLQNAIRFQDSLQRAIRDAYEKNVVLGLDYLAIGAIIIVDARSMGCEVKTHRLGGLLYRKTMGFAALCPS
jgi:curli biogenesis system outer membrane secretion channel CsgG